MLDGVAGLHRLLGQLLDQPCRVLIACAGMKGLYPPCWPDWHPSP